jgi:hypothetical protein
METPIYWNVSNVGFHWNNPVSCLVLKQQVRRA